MQEAAAAPQTVGMADWSLLPVDLLVDIISSLDIPGLVRFGVVCSSWRAAYSTFRRLRLPASKQAPCLLYSSEEDSPDTATLYSLSGQESFRVRLPDPPLRSRSLIGSAYGWLVTADEHSNLHLLNPLTGSQIALPPVWMPRRIEKSTYKHRNLASNFHPAIFLRVVLSCSPSAGSACIVLLMHYPDGKLSFARLGDYNWTWVSRPEIVGWPLGYQNAVYNNDDGIFYVVRRDGAIYALDVNEPFPVAKEIMHQTTAELLTSKYIVLTPRGEFFQVCRRTVLGTDLPVSARLAAVYGGHPYYAPKTKDILCCKVDFKHQKLVNTDLRDYVLFLGFNCPFLVSSKDFPMLKSNCAYLTDDYDISKNIKKYSTPEIGIWDLKSKTLQKLHDAAPPCRPWLHWPAPIWIMPSLD